MSNKDGAISDILKDLKSLRERVPNWGSEQLKSAEEELLPELEKRVSKLEKLCNVGKDSTK